MIQYNLFQNDNNLFSTPIMDSLQELKKLNIFGLDYCSTAIFSGKYGIPLLKSYTGEIPDKFITYKEAASSQDFSCGVAGIEEDELLERIWRTPAKYVKRFSPFSCVCSPDFSLKIGEPLCVEIANTYRSHAIAYFLQENAIEVLPSVAWGDRSSFEFCFDGCSKGGAVMVSTIGTMKDERSRFYFKAGFIEMLERLSPDAVVLYGDVNDELLSWMPKQLEIRSISHSRFYRARHGK